jgi:hypothetical protein
MAIKDVEASFFKMGKEQTDAMISMQKDRSISIT